VALRLALHLGGNSGQTSLWDSCDFAKRGRVKQRTTSFGICRAAKSAPRACTYCNARLPLFSRYPTYYAPFHPACLAASPPPTAATTRTVTRANACALAYRLNGSRTIPALPATATPRACLPRLLPPPPSPAADACATASLPLSLVLAALPTRTGIAGGSMDVMARGTRHVYHGDARVVPVYAA